MCVSERTLMMGMMKIKISTPSLSDLMERFSELSVLNIQYGLDDINPKYGNRFSLLRQEEGEHVISRGVQSEARIFLRNGVTPSLRQKLWRLALGLTPATTEEEEARYATLRHQCDEYDVLTDEMFLLDVQSVADDHRFFPFGDVIRDLVLCFSRDRMQCAYEVHPVQIRDKKRDSESDSERNGSEYEGEGGADDANRAGGNRRHSGLHRNQQDDAVTEDRNGNGDRNGIDHGSSSSSSNFKSSDKNGLNTSVGTNRNVTDVITTKSNVLSATDSESISRPLHSERKENGGLDTVPDRLSQGTQPFLGFSSYIAPLCYLCTDKPALYSLASNMWSTVWCKLNVLTGDDGALLHICKTFENLLAFLDQKLFLHLLSIGIEPLKVAFPWLQMAFVGFFEIDQLLILWDRVLGFHDLTIFSLLAVAIFTSRSQPILLCESPEAATVILNEGSRLKVIPLLQMILYAEK